MDIKVASWNINSVRLRIDQVIRFLNEEQPDVLGLQEIKCQNEQFPYEPFRQAGYAFIEVAGMKGYHGAATVSKLPMERLPTSFCPLDHARHVSTRIVAGSAVSSHQPSSSRMGRKVSLLFGLGSLSAR